MAPISIDFLANVGPFLRGTKDVEGALDDVSSSLDDVARDGAGIGDDIGDSLRDAARDAERAGDDIGDSLTDAARDGRRAGDDIGDSMKDAARDAERAGDDIGDSMKDAAREAERAGDDLGDSMSDGAKEAERSVDRIEDSFRDMARKVKAESKTAGDGVGDDFKRGADRASDGVREIGDEAASTAKEAAASFDGSAESIGDAFQEVAANAFAGFGPAGLIAGVAAAAGIGLALSALEAGGEETEEYKARVSELTDKFIEAGGVGEQSFDQIADKLRTLATDGDEVAGTLADILERADKTGVSVADLTTAFTGNEEAIARQIAAAKRIVSEYDQMAAAAAGDTSKLDGNLASRSLWAQTSIRKLEEVRVAVDAAKENERLYLESGAADMERRAAQAEDYSDRVADALSDSGLAYEEQNRILDAQIESARGVVTAYDDMVRAAQGDASQVDANLESRARWAREVIGQWEGVKQANTDAAQNEIAYAQSGLAELAAKGERVAEYASSIAENLTGAGEDWEQYADKETGALDLEKYNANIEARVVAMENYRANMASLQGNINSDALAYLESLGADAAPLLQAYVDAPNAQKERTAANWATLGRTAASSYTGDLKAGIPSTIDGPTVVAGVDSSAVDNYISGLPRKRLPGPTFFMKIEENY